MKHALRWSALVVLAAALALGTTRAQNAPSLTLALTGDSIITRPISVFNEPAHTGCSRLFVGPTPRSRTSRCSSTITSPTR